MPTIKELVDEAEENFGTGRHQNSAQLFKRAGLETLNRGMIDGLYLIYRSLYDMNKIRMDLEPLYVMRETAISLVTLIAKRTASMLEEGHENQIDLLKLAEQSLLILNQEDERESVIQMLQKLLIKEFTKTGDLSNIKSAVDRNSEPHLILILYYTTICHAYSKTNEAAFDGDLVAAALILDLFQSYPIEDMNEIKGNAIQYSELNLNPPQLVELIINDRNNFTIGDLIATGVKLVRDIAHSSFNSNTTVADIQTLFIRYDIDWITI